jgi:hypothetical protein
MLTTVLRLLAKNLGYCATKETGGGHAIAGGDDRSWSRLGCDAASRGLASSAHAQAVKGKMKRLVAANGRHRR